MFSWDGYDCNNIVNMCKCDLTKRGNNVCDDECNNLECDYDFGDCCDKSKLGDGLCDAECNFQGLGYDHKDCLQQLCQCELQKIGDGLCNYDCYNLECGFDLGDCCESWMLDNNFCDLACMFNPLDFECVRAKNCDCDPNLIGDNICQPECVTWGCAFDLGDCCSKAMLDNDSCDYECYSPNFNWDGLTCLQHSNDCKCTKEQLGDGSCDWECLTAECEFDYGDCCEP